MSEATEESQSDLMLKQLKQIKQLSEEVDRQKAEAQRHLAGRQLAELKLGAVGDALGLHGASAETLAAQVHTLLDTLRSLEKAHAELRTHTATLLKRSAAWSRYVECGAGRIDVTVEDAAEKATALARFADQLLVERDARFRSPVDDGD